MAVQAASCERFEGNYENIKLCMLSTFYTYILILFTNDYFFVLEKVKKIFFGTPAKQNQFFSRTKLTEEFFKFSRNLKNSCVICLLKVVRVLTGGGLEKSTSVTKYELVWLLETSLKKPTLLHGYIYFLFHVVIASERNVVCSSKKMLVWKTHLKSSAI